MQESTATRFCMAACIFIILISLCMNLVVGLNVFGTMTPSPLINGSTGDMTNIESGGDTYNLQSILSNNLLSIITVTGSTALFILIVFNCVRTGSYAILGPVLFTLVFWNSWIANISFFASSGYFNSGAMLTVFGIITTIMVFVFIGAVAGMLGGNE